jgi:hypothetical protein
MNPIGINHQLPIVRAPTDFDKHSSFADLTQRSESAFKFGLGASNRSVFT